MLRTVVVIGASPAGGTAAATPRDVRRSFEPIRSQVPDEAHMRGDPEIDPRILVRGREGA